MKKSSLILLSTFALLFAPTGAGAQSYDTSAATIVCNTLIGSVGSKPPLTLTPQANVQITIKGTLSGCTVTGATPVDPPLQVLSGKMTAKLSLPGDSSCATLISAFQGSGNFVFKWKTASGQKLDFPATTFVPDAAGLVAGLLPYGSGTYGTFTSTGALAADSAFAGATPGFVVVSAEDVYNILGQCCTDPTICSPVGKGVKKLHFGIGQFQM